MMSRWLLCVCLIISATGAYAADKKAVYTLQYQAFAPNAGGQSVYGLRYRKNDREWGLFANQYLRAGPYPVTGIVYDWHFPICGSSCFWQFYFNAGVGLTQIGPLGEVMWGTDLLWFLRLDFATHFYLTNQRMFLWSMPLWVGLTVSF